MTTIHSTMTIPRLLGVLGILLALTALTVSASKIDLGVLNIWIALGIASVKASLVLLFFMHLKYENRFIKLALLGTVGCIALIISLLFWDIAFR